MEEVHSTYKPVRFGWIEALVQSGAGPRRLSRRAALRGGVARQRIPGLY